MGCVQTKDLKGNFSESEKSQIRKLAQYLFSDKSKLETRFVDHFRLNKEIGQLVFAFFSELQSIYADQTECLTYLGTLSQIGKGSLSRRTRH